jgi:hypothetical protein
MGKVIYNETLFQNFRGAASVTCRIAKTISDEIESEVEDPRQQKLL